MALQFQDDMVTTFAAWPMAAIGLGQTNVTTDGKAAPIPGAIEILPTPTGDGSGYCVTCKPGDPITNGAIRACIAYGREPAHNNGNAAERWYRWDWYFPPDFYAEELMSVMQFHDTPDSAELPVIFPNFEFMAQGDDLWVWTPLSCTVRGQALRNPPGRGIIKIPSIRGRWLRCAIHCNWSNASDGYLEVWLDDTLMVRDWFRANAYADLVGPYWVVGIYDWTHGGLSREYRLWHRNAKVYNTGHTAQEVLGAEPKLPPAPVLPVVLKHPDVVYEGPLIINDALISSRGSNIFEGNWEQQLWADNPGGNGQGAAIVIKTTQPVVLRNSRLRARRYCIHWDIGTIDLTLDNCILECLNPMQANEASGPAMNIVGPKNLVVEHCTFIGGGGIQLAETPAAGAFVRIRYNRALNIDGRMSDGAGGYVFEQSNSTAYFKSRQFLQLRGNIVIADGEVAWNEVVNEPFISRREDAFSVFGGSGVSTKPFWIHDNVVKGGASPRPYDNGYSGAGFVVEDARAVVTDTSVAQYVDIDDNQVIGATNVGLGFVGDGVSHVRARRNRFVSCGRINGLPIYSTAMNSPVNVYEGGGTTGPSYAELVDNGYSWRNSATSTQYNAAWFNVPGNPGNVNTGGYAIAAITDEALEAAEWTAWVAKKAAAGVVCGSSLSV